LCKGPRCTYRAPVIIAIPRTQRLTFAEFMPGKNGGEINERREPRGEVDRVKQSRVVKYRKSNDIPTAPLMPIIKHRRDDTSFARNELPPQSTSCSFPLIFHQRTGIRAEISAIRYLAFTISTPRESAKTRAIPFPRERPRESPRERKRSPLALRRPRYTCLHPWGLAINERADISGR